ncbi:MAG: hypothetical protein ACKVKV_00980 [Dehalococcoidia bacterium]
MTTLDETGKVGEHTSITIGADGLGLISYRDELTLKPYWCDSQFGGVGSECVSVVCV